jgi:hypothetical protein
VRRKNVRNAKIILKNGVIIRKTFDTIRCRASHECWLDIVENAADSFSSQDSAACFCQPIFLQTTVMKITRCYTGPDNESHFEEFEAPFKTAGDMEATAIEEASAIYFRRAPAGHIQDWHPAPRRQYIITLSGQVEIEIGDGTKRRFGPGNVFLADDTAGRGHITRVVGNQPRVYVTIPLK